MFTYFRSLRRLSQEAFAVLVQQDVDTITAWEDLKPAPRPADLRDMATLLRVTVDTLIEREPSHPLTARRLRPSTVPPLRDWSPELVERWGADPYALWGYVEITAPGGVQERAYPIDVGAASLLDAEIAAGRRGLPIAVRTRNNRLLVLPAHDDRRVRLVALENASATVSPGWDGDGLSPEVYRGLLSWAVRDHRDMFERGPQYQDALAEARRLPAMRTRAGALTLLDTCRLFRSVGRAVTIRAVSFAVQAAARAFSAGVPVVMLLSHDEREERLVNTADHWLIDLPATDLGPSNFWRM